MRGHPSHQMRVMGIAMGGAVVAAVSTMFVPVGVLERITSATGMSEILQAAAPPLGDTARALIAFATGVLASAVIALVLLRQNGETALVEGDAHSAPSFESAREDGDTSLMGRFREALPVFALPWKHGENDITELSDLPKLRDNDSHPDAPPRRPLSAVLDLPVLAPVGEKCDEHQAVPPAFASIGDRPLEAPEEPGFEPVIEPAAEMPVADLPAEPAAPAAAPAASLIQDVQPTLEEMVAQLEASVAQRQRQLAELEEVAARLAAEQAETLVGEPIVERDVAEAFATPLTSQRPPLEAVAPSGGPRDDIDAALESALATLHRMNAIGR